MTSKEEKYDAICYVLDKIYHSDEWEAARGYTLVENIINGSLGVSKEEFDIAIGED